MSLLWADGFSLYGTGSVSDDNMQQGVWAAVNANIQCATTNPRSPGTHHIRINSSNAELRRIFGADKATGAGFGAAHYIASLPSADSQMVLADFRDGSNVSKLTLTVTTTGVIQLRQGGPSGTILASSAAVFTASAYQHIEAFAVLHASAGEVEVRRNGETVLSFSGATGTGTLEQVAIRWQGTAGPNWDVTDVQCWDIAGSINNDFLGDVIWLRVNPDADLAVTDWVRNTGSTDFSCINEATPDGDTTYIEASASGNISEFTMGNLPAQAADVVAVITQPMARKTDAGAGSLRASLLSSGSPASESLGANRPITTTYTYYPDVHEVDPATGVRWTPTAVNAMRLRLNRTA